ncbi:hypothetical protein NQ318_012567 [Aromia moschata]|uniref:Reverse transcriptase domain-containing protein n=1 Tax=Aromia moschata TaxID=1265417 RepID=A0AAV8YKK3_9CUCU|nr:hypothetical protein NQ318_012567 [Aromia moschata]
MNLDDLKVGIRQEVRRISPAVQQIMYKSFLGLLHAIRPSTVHKHVKRKSRYWTDPSSHSIRRKKALTQSKRKVTPRSGDRTGHSNDHRLHIHRFQNDKSRYTMSNYNGEYFQHEGTAMGNSLSPFIANLFMSKFETEVKDKFEYFPRVWFRYVDDIFAVFDTKAISLDNFVAKLNNRFPTIKFTYDVEHNEQLPFLDVLVIKNSENKLEFDRTLYNSTTFRRDTDNSKFASLPYEPKFTRGLDKIFKNININLVYNSKNKLQTLLGKPKDKIDNNVRNIRNKL